ncbi:2-C-methyl-D-erythritol 4-phosphate cytidylyltransferase [Alkalitalea saponilacus]|uniref:2-C-methyl-D-erythritol 4-phosphate cytidylyltransferase n=1 Tax=Alkalitalea saponilacus TaxID=889453 RepID=A0A1T5A5G6_9BACT|nr:2-C-methyl-D-erythritol 4-phosphate cytidylyltransferase [Alkalitalea saponilacus]ASB48842.1 2-C-methyl-D-erythritol 4-phosphate cytidylyltransferase [Alkalitalea saponilacus]SKB30200.1 2-C-methyl-D-erythritol 4-phosphate cytidylyltransferase [Alkalitalea saponilacus]
MHQNIIIVAGGKGLRMGAELPKQFLPIGQKPVLMHTIEAFHHFDPKISIILVLPLSHQKYWEELCEKHQFLINHRLANGGVTRFESVKNGLELVDDAGMTGVHDGVRPFVSRETISRCFKNAEIKGAVIPVLPPVESLREVSGDSSFARERQNYRMVQTPQVFQTALLKKAYSQSYEERFTDDASVVEALGCQIHHVEGNVENIKITSPFDMIIAEALWNENRKMN